MYLRWSAAAFALLSLMSACADLRWHRTDSDAATLERDLTECRRVARADTAHLAWPFPDGPTRVVSVDRAGRAVTTPYPYPTALDTDRWVLQFERIGACMREKGYALVPAEAPPGNSAPE